MDNERLKQEMFDWIKSEERFLAIPVGGVEIVSLPSNELLEIKVDEEEHVTLLTKSGEYLFLGVSEINPAELGLVQIGRNISINANKVTRVDHERKLIWVEDEKFMVDVDRWEYFLQRMAEIQK